MSMIFCSSAIEFSKIFCPDSKDVFCQRRPHERHAKAIKTVIQHGTPPDPLPDPLPGPLPGRRPDPCFFNGSRKSLSMIHGAQGMY